MKKKTRGRCYLLAGMLLLSGCGREQTVKKETETEKDCLVIMTNDLNEGGDIEQFMLEAGELLGLEIEVIGCSANPYAREAEISTLLSEGDSSVDIIMINDEMMSSLAGTGYLEDLSEIMSGETLDCYPSLYMQEISMVGDNVYSVPCFLDLLCLWINQEKLEQTGLDAIEDREDFLYFLQETSQNGCYGYGGAWERAYAYNEIGLFVNLFGGDMLDWKNEKTVEAVSFLHDMATEGYVSGNLVNDQHEQMLQKFFDGETGCVFMYTGAMPNFIASGMYDESRIRIAPMPEFSQNVTYISTWQFVLNAASERKEMARQFLSYMAGREGSLHYAETMTRLPARTDALNIIVQEREEFQPLQQYISETLLLPRPLPEEPTRYIEAVGEAFQKYIMDEITLEEYCWSMESVIAEFF